MLIDTITSRSNPFVKRFVAAREGRDRHVIFIEGVRLVEEALHSHIVFEAIAYSPRLCDTRAAHNCSPTCNRSPAGAPC